MLFRWLPFFVLTAGKENRLLQIHLKSLAVELLYTSAAAGVSTSQQQQQLPQQQQQQQQQQQEPRLREDVCLAASTDGDLLYLFGVREKSEKQQTSLKEEVILNDLWCFDIKDRRWKCLKSSARCTDTSICKGYVALSCFSLFFFSFCCSPLCLCLLDTSAVSVVCRSALLLSHCLSAVFLSAFVCLFCSFVCLLPLCICWFVVVVVCLFVCCICLFV